MKIFLIGFISAVLILSSCRDFCKYADIAFAHEQTVSIVFKDKDTGEILIDGQGSKYFESDISAIGENNSNLKLSFKPRPMSLTDENSYRAQLSNIILSSDAAGSEICRRIFISFKTDQDTIDYCYRIKSEECGGTEVSSFKLKYNSKEIKADDENLKYYTIFK
jgi:hypothetical protein